MRRQYDKNGRHRVRNTGAAIAGAAQGVTTGLRDEHLVEESTRAIRNIRSVSRAVSRGSRQEWQSAEIRGLREDARVQSERLRKTGSQAVDAFQERSGEVQHWMKDTGQSVQKGLGQGVGNVQQAGTYVVVQGREKAQSVAEATRRARRAPGHIMNDVKAAKDSYTQSVKVNLASMGGVVFLGGTSFILLTIGLVVAFNALLGTPAGYFITLALYLLGAGALMMYGRSSRESNRDDAREHMRDVRREVQFVAQPLRNTFTTRVTKGESNDREKTRTRTTPERTATRTRHPGGEPLHAGTQPTGGVRSNGGKRSNG